MNSIKYPEVGWRFNSQEEQFFFELKKIDLNIIYMKVYEEYSEQIQNQFKWKYVNGFKKKTM